MDLPKIQQILSLQLESELADWEIEELAEKIAALPQSAAKQVIKHLPVIWPVSYALFNAFVETAGKAGTCLHPSQYNDWVKGILDVYESEGLRQAQLYMEQVEQKFLCRIRGEQGVRLEDIETRLVIYGRSILGRELKISPSQNISFDTDTVYLPPEVNYFQKNRDNFLFYKFTVTFLLALDRLDTFRLPTSSETTQDPLSEFFQATENPRLAADLFYLAEGIRIARYLKETFEGLLIDCRDLLTQIHNGRKKILFVSPAEKCLEEIRIWLLEKLHNSHATNQSIHSAPIIHLLDQQYPNDAEASVSSSLTLTKKLLDHISSLAGSYEPGHSLPFMGDLTAVESFEVSRKRKKALEEKFITALSAVIAPDVVNKNSSAEDEKSISSLPAVQNETASILLFVPQKEKKAPDEYRSEATPTHIKINNIDLELNLELRELAQDIIRENGHIPEHYISSAVGRAGNGLTNDSAENDSQSQTLCGPLIYDEWDFRRSGFRKNWCSVTLKEITPNQGTFVANTLEKYRGLLSNLKRQFEMMSLEEKYIKRQRDGNDIDLDAAIDYLSDTKAGLAPSERLFIRLQRNDRNIAALFLVDMSSSTEGWVNTAIKESLILMCESLSALGDRYAIYGFSGMRRSRSEFFKVKDFDEKYDDLTKGRIAAISPMEYTRMGPAIRHAGAILSQTDAQARLLITLTDGKPEDYDGYKGSYAIEDARHALFEVKASGIHPFCITIDRKAHDYMDHLFGEVNYIFIDDVSKLPRRMPEIYRNLTT